MNMAATPSPQGRQGIISLHIKDKEQLANQYIPFFKSGGIFYPTPRKYKLGDEVFLLLQFFEEKERLPVAGKIVMITPTGAQGGRMPGIGIQLSDTPENEQVRGKIETLLAGTPYRNKSSAAF